MYDCVVGLYKFKVVLCMLVFVKSHAPCKNSTIQCLIFQGHAFLHHNLCVFIFQNDVTEQEQRWGAKTVEGSGHQESIR